jgi:alkylhydroperoxidase family enzyme
MASAPIQPVESAPRIAALPMEAMRQQWLDILARIPGDGLKGKGFPRNVLGMIMHNPETFGPFLEYWVSSKSLMGLSVREQELVILRMASLFRSTYVWKHHVPVAKEFGCTDAEIEATRVGVYGSIASARERSLLELTDEMVERRTVGPQAWAENRPNLADRDVVDLVSLVSQYVFFALMNNTFQVQVEPALDDVISL